MVEINIFNQARQTLISGKKLKKIIKTILNELKVSGKILLSVHLVGEKRIRELNFRYRGVNRATDVISFAVNGADFSGERDLGDIFICLAKVKKQAKIFVAPPEEEFCRLLAHGILHLLGHDHAGVSDSNRMFSKQEELVKKIFD